MLRALFPLRIPSHIRRTTQNCHFTSLTMAKRKLAETSGITESELPNPAKKLKSKVAKGKSKAVDVPQYGSRPVSLWKVGAHVSAAGGLENAIINAAAIGANSFALFVKSQRKWTSPPLTESTISSFKAALIEHGYEPRHILPHGSYLINLGNPDAEKRQKSYDCFLDDLKRCESLGLLLYNFHPGSSVGQATSNESISFIAGCINEAHKATESVVTVLENMAGAGNIIGGDFNHLAKIISEVDDKTRIGVCLDTCHMFAAGYDLRTKEGWEKIVTDFDTIVGLSYLRGMHLNDSKTEHNSKKDRHENIGIGHIGIQGFHHILNDPRFQDIPLILETPSFEKPEVWATEINALNSLSGAPLDTDADAGEQQLESVMGEIKAVVEKFAGPVKAKKKEKEAKKVATKKGNKKQKKKQEEEEDDSE
ncbi:xylose isomerase-like protein [Mycena alexandri]|uniref:Apurinic-apyrimidinic endonuclease 1 n=1 Tax=Mycena alexandri TaxID=1745969 RepID=A0AAD6T8W4_9AGAR|nr:xylose isomerase-like protein [Mycena alexandri]